MAQQGHLSLSSVAARRAACLTPAAAAAAAAAAAPLPRPTRRSAAVWCSSQGEAGTSGQPARRELLLGAAALVAGAAAGQQPASAIELGFKKDLTNKRRLTIPEDAYTEGPEGLKIYDVVVGTGPEAEEGKRIVVHFDAKWKGVTFITTRQGMGVTGGQPFGFDVGAKPGRGGAGIRGLDLGVRGMRVGGRRKLLVPPNLAYGEKGRGEIPPNATLSLDVELLSIKKDARGYQVKLVEG